MGKHREICIFLALLVTSLAAPPRNPLGLLISEVNLKDTSDVEEKEFVEFIATARTSRDTLQGYYVVGVRGMSSESTLKGSTVELSISLWNMKMPKSR